ncbi:MAG TPA: S53 family peptidase [Streptosporangiaceae bacterium]|nr:S53 family peptidase [Streptosporangiaceae bacterium]
MRLSRASSARLVVAAAAVLAAVAGGTVIGSATALGSTAGSASSASGPGALIVHPATDHVHGAFLTPVPVSDAQCEAVYQIRCYVPDQVEAAYNLPALYSRGINGKGRTIVLVDAFGSPTIANDLLQFDQYLGLGTPPLRIVKVGKVPPFDSGNGDMAGWADETTLDVEYAHAGAPNAKLVLVEVGQDNLQQLALGVKYAVQHKLGDVISLSWGLPEQDLGRKFVSSYGSVFSQAAKSHITVVVSSGDSGVSGPDNNNNYYRHPVASWPATSPFVTAVGGTKLNLNASGGRNGHDAAWNDTYSTAVSNFFFGNEGPNPLATGGGKSAYYARPSYQKGVRGVTGNQRGIPDISMSASCSVAVNVFETFSGGQGGWGAFCGTSESAPMFAAIVALADQAAGRSLGLINPALYALAAKHAAGIVPVAAGNNTVSFSGVTVHGYSVRKGYNLATGLGSVNGKYLVPELAHAA